MTSSIVWSLDPLLYTTLPQSLIIDVISTVAFSRSVYASLIGFSILYPTMHTILIKTFKKYRGIESSAKKIVILHHFMEFLFLSAIFPVFTYYVIRMFFQIHDIEAMRSNLISLFQLSMSMMTMYCFELATRFENPRPMIVFHHLLATLDGFLVLLFPSTTFMKTGAILVYFICFEAIVFLGLFMYRVFPQSMITPRVIHFGMILFACSRPLQLLLIIAIIKCSWGDQNFVMWHAIIQIVFTVVLTAVQLWSVTIHYGILKKCKQNGKQEKILDAGSKC